MAKGFVDYLRAALGWWSSPPVAPVVTEDFICVESATIAVPYSLAAQGSPTTLATLCRADSNATIQRPTTHAGLRRAYALATQRPC